MEERRFTIEDRINEELEANELYDWPDDLPEMEIISHNNDPIGD